VTPDTPATLIFLHVEAGTTLFRGSRIAAKRAIGAVLLLAITGAVAGIVYGGSPQTLAEGVTIAGIDVGGLTAGEARRLLEGRSAALAATPVVFTSGSGNWPIKPETLDVKVNWAAAVDAARRQGAGLGPFRGFKRLQVRMFGADVAPPVGVYAPALDYKIKLLASDIDHRPSDARVELAGLKPVIVPAQTGRRLDRDASARVLVRALASFERHPVGLPVRVDLPKVGAAKLRPALAQVETALSAPVRLIVGSTAFRVPRWRLATLLDLPENGATKLRVGGPAATEYFAKLAKTVGRAPVDAQFAVHPGGRVSIIDDKPGIAVDVPRTAKSLLAASLSLTDRQGQIFTTASAAERTASKAAAMGITGIVGSYETIYGGSEDRRFNVQLVSRLIDNHLIAPGETFSFNGTTGERTADKGFREAPVIINGELQNGLGGGICQVSTTLFNAAYEAGLKVMERTNHALYISHYPLGRDATVDYPSLDLKFVNDTGKWLLLRTFVGSSSLVVNLYGTPQDRKVETEAAPLQTTGAIPVKRVPDPTLEKGQTVTEETGQPPRATSVHRKVFTADGELLYDNVWYSSYRGEPTVLRVGTKPKPKPEVVVPKPKAEKTPGAKQPPAEAPAAL
jgi:vancomycin resistance protein YoaR